MMQKKRLVLEYNAMTERWAAMQPLLCRDSSAERLWWELNLKAEAGNSLPITIEYPSDYPASPPNIVVRVALPSGTPHLLTGNRMCWYYPGEKSRHHNIWCPGRDTAAMCVGVALRWFYSFLVWHSIGEWPVPDSRA